MKPLIMKLTVRQMSYKTPKYIISRIYHTYIYVIEYNSFLIQGKEVYLIKTNFIISPFINNLRIAVCNVSYTVQLND